jgi:hypothetical protein
MVAVSDFHQSHSDTVVFGIPQYLKTIEIFSGEVISPAPEADHKRHKCRVCKIVCVNGFFI